MKTVIAGSRDITNYKLIKECLDNLRFPVTEVISGTARGVDQLGERWAKERAIPVSRFPADWNRYGKRAGYLRNLEMAEYAERAVIFWDGVSKGTKMMLELAGQHGCFPTVFLVQDGELVDFILDHPAAAPAGLKEQGER